GEYFKKKGEQVRSTSLVASGADASFDAFLTFSVLVSVLLNMIFNIRIEAYIGLMISVFIIKAGYELISDQTSELLGRRPDAKLSQTIKKVVNSDPDVLGAYDLTLHNYGPNRLIGSVHVTVNDTMIAKDIDRMTRRIQKTVMEQTGVFLTAVSIYSRNTMDDTVTKMTKQINQILSKKDYILQMHGLYIDHEKKSINFDVVIDFDCPDPQALHREIVEEVQQTFPDYNVQIVIDNDFSE
ncbi:MAG: cation transporter, partial [Erysipelotrichaceae bacterium]|nr:cation transporter [Erysipelotrichaceae bacterium]